MRTGNVLAYGEPQQGFIRTSEGKMADVDTRITLALHPDSIASLDWYNDSTAPLVMDATEGA